MTSQSVASGHVLAPVARARFRVEGQTGRAGHGRELSVGANKVAVAVLGIFERPGGQQVAVHVLARRCLTNIRFRLANK